MSGATSIPIAFIALFWTAGNERKILALTAFCALFVMAARLVWKNIEAKAFERPKQLRSVLKKMTELINTNYNHLGSPSYKDSIGALIECSEEIETEEEVEWLCDELKKHHYDHPFKEAEFVMDNFMKGERLSVLREASLNGRKIRTKLNFDDFLVGHWSHAETWRAAIKAHNEKWIQQAEIKGGMREP